MSIAVADLSDSSTPSFTSVVPPELSVQLFEPVPSAVYTIDETAHLVGMPRHMILVCCKHGLVAAAVDAVSGGYRFDAGAIRTLRRLDALREVIGFNVGGLRLTLELLGEIDRLREDLRQCRGKASGDKR